MLFNHVTLNEVKKIIMQLKNKKSFGFDGIPDFILKKCADNIKEPLADIMNACFSEGIFPTVLKLSIIKPIFKKGSKYDFSNYRPVILLSVFSKKIRKMFSQFATYFSRCK